MTPTPARNSPAGIAYNELRNLAKRNHRDVAEYITLYALEGLLVRLAVSPQAPDFVLKGGVLMAAFYARRPTRDIDLRASGFPGDVAECEGRIRQFLAIEVDDGLTFNPTSVWGEVIRDGDDYTGARITSRQHWPRPAFPSTLISTSATRSGPHRNRLRYPASWVGPSTCRDTPTTWCLPRRS